MAYDDCIRIINEAVGRDLSDDELELILDALQREVNKRRTAGKLDSLNDGLFDAAENLAQELGIAAALEKRNELINLRARQSLDARVDAAMAETGDAAAGVRAATVGSNQRFAGARASVDARGNALTAEYLVGLIADLRREGVLADFNSRALDREIARELAELSKPDGSPGLTGSDPALKIARAIDKVKRASIARENRAGAHIRLLPGHIVRQSHDMHRIRRAGFEAWRDFILPRLDADRTFEGVDDIEAFLEGAYNGIKSGRHLKSNGADESDALFAFTGPGNLAKRESQHRVLHFRDADAWFDYNEEFGRRSLVESIFADFERAARNTALMETFGTNPRAMFDTWLRDIENAQRADDKQMRPLVVDALRNQFAEIEGETRIPVSASLANVSAGVRAIQSMAKLGGATLSAFGDLGFKAGVLLRQTDRNIFEAWGATLESFVDGVAPGDRARVAELLAVGFDTQIGEIASRWSAQDDVPGRMAKLQTAFFKLNLLAPWTEANKRGIAMMLSRDLALDSSKAFDALPANTRETLRLYGMDADRWEIARQAVRRGEDGRDYLIPSAVRELDDGLFAGIAASGSARSIRAAKDDLATMLQSYLSDLADEAVPTPGARERAFLRQGTRPGTPQGELLRFIGQFKAFPVTVLMRNHGRNMAADTTGQFVRNLIQGRGDLQGLAHLLVATTVLGYLSMAAKDLAKGRTPRDPVDGGTITAAFLQGGGAGIYGDFLFGEFNRFGRSALATAAGPSIGAVDDMVELWARFRAGEDAAASSVRFVMGNTPFVNLFYTRLAIDHMFLFQLQEAINPGYLRRMERRVAKENGQSFILPPSQNIPRGGGGRMLEGVR